jgi:DNA-binding transcriptional regulator LsrR (DeoR family)
MSGVKKMTKNGRGHSTLNATGSTPSEDREFLARVAYFHYVEGLTQNIVAEKFGISRVRVNRMLAQARSIGLVKVRIDTSLNLRAEADLEKKFGLERAVVVPSPDNAMHIPEAIAAAAGTQISDRLQDGMSLGVGWGRTLRMSVGFADKRKLTGVSIVSLLGGLTRGSVMNTYETASRLADLYEADCFYIAAPAFADDEETARVLRDQSGVRDAFDRARKIDVALLSVGALNENSTMSRLGLIGASDLESLSQKGAVGDLCAQWIDANGHVVDHPLNRRVIAFSVDELANIPCVILASGGKDKVAAILATLKRGLVKILITDETTALDLLR